MIHEKVAPTVRTIDLIILRKHRQVGHEKEIVEQLNGCGLVARFEVDDMG